PGAALGAEPQVLQRLPTGFFIQRGWALAGVDVGNAQAGVSCVRVLNVGDAAVNLLYLGGNTGRAVSTFAHVGWEVGAFAFPLAGGSRQELLEVIGSTGLIGTVDNGDVGVWKLNTLVFRSNSFIVPLGDVTSEDLRQGLGGEVDWLFNALQV